MNAIAEKNGIARQLRMRAKQAVSTPLKNAAQLPEEATPRAPRAVHALVAHPPPPAAAGLLGSEVPGPAAAHMPHLTPALPRGLGVHLVGQGEVREGGVGVDVAGAAAARGCLGRIADG